MTAHQPQLPEAGTDPRRGEARTGAAAPAQLFFLRIVRLMATGGIDDARAATLLLGRFGRAYRRPLILTRALVLELARTSHRKITLASPCCHRITSDEVVILRAIGRSDGQFRQRHEDACRLLDRDNALGAATCFQAVGECFADLGLRLD